MAILEFIEDDAPSLPPRPVAPPPAATAAAQQDAAVIGKQKRAAAMVDLTASPPPEGQRSKRAKMDKVDALQSYFGASDAAPPQVGAAASTATGQMGGIGARKVVYTGAPPPPTLQGYGAGPQALGPGRGAIASSFAQSSSSTGQSTGFARYSTTPRLQANASSSSAASTPFALPSRSLSHPSPRQHQHQQLQTGGAGFLPPTPATTYATQKIPVISSASAARLPSRALPMSNATSTKAGQPPSRTSSTGSNGGGPGKNYYKMQSSAVSASLSALAKQGILPPPPGKRQSSLNALSSSSSAASPSNVGASTSTSTGVGKAPVRSATVPSSSGASGSGLVKKTAGGMIDLTSLEDGSSSSDDDVIISDDPVCIGQLTSLALILYPVSELLPPPPPPPSSATTSNPASAPAPPPQPAGPLPPLPVHVLRCPPQAGNETLKLVTPGLRETFGVMEHRVANVLGPLLGDGWAGTGTGGAEGVERWEKEKGKAAAAEGWLGRKVWVEASVVRRQERNPMMLPLHLLLFCRRSSVPTISSLLENATLFLEHPSHYNPSLHHHHAYLNPHNPAVGVGGAGKGREPGMAGWRAGGGGVGIGAGGGRESATEVQRREVEQVFREIKTGADLDVVVPPSIIATPLYPHQAQALSFLLDREALIPIPARDPEPRTNPTIVSLWQRVNDTYGRAKGWRSLVAEREIEGGQGVPQARGAILADDMGLGKTIVVISLVSITMNLSRAWASLPPSREQHDSRLDDIRTGASKSTSATSRVSINDFQSTLYGTGHSEIIGTIAAPPTTPGGVPLGPNGKPLSKKALAKRKREQRRDNASEERFDKLVVRSRATLIVCPLSTVQNWEAQFEEHSKRVKGVKRGVRIKEVEVEVEGEGGRKEKKVEKREVDVEEEEAEREGLGDELRKLREEPERREEKRGGKASGKGKRRKAPKRAAGVKKRKTNAIADSEEDDDAAFIAPSDEDDSMTDSDSNADDSDDEDTSRPPLSIYIYHGNSRLSDPRKLADYDVVITTFSTLGTEYSKQQRAEEEREEELEARKRAGMDPEESEDELVQVYGFDERGEVIETKPGEEIVQAGKPIQKKKPKRSRRKVEGSGVSPLQQIQWFRVVLDEAHIIKEHSTIQARAACELSAARRIALSGTPLQNSLNDLFSLVRFLRLEPFTDRPVWTQFIGSLVKAGDPLGVERLQLIMRHLTLRRTKESTDKDGKPILSLPPVSHKVVRLKLDPAEHAFYQSHHLRYKHAFEKLEETDSVLKNFCSILQEILRLRQICVHMALVKDAEDVGGDLIEVIKQHGISKPRAMQLLSLMKDAGAAQCVECGVEMLAGVAGGNEADEDVKNEGSSNGKRKPPVTKRARKPAAGSASGSALNSEDDQHLGASTPQQQQSDSRSIVTRCQHLFCRPCFIKHVYAGWGSKMIASDRSACSVCKMDLTPALDAVEIGVEEFEKALEESRDDEDLEGGEDEKPKRGATSRSRTIVSKKDKKAKPTRFFEHSTKTKALVADLLPFSRANPASPNYWGGQEEERTEETGGTIGFQPVKGEVVKSVVFSQWTKLLDRLGDALENENIGFRRLDGGMNREQRTRAMDAFRVDPTCEVLLVSLRAGGVGLNLTAGRRVYLMEPFWNPAVENQAVDRVYRLGQTMPVQTVRFIIEKSVEERMLDIQKKKTDLANQSLKQTKSKAELAAERIADFKHLLG